MAARSWPVGLPDYFTNEQKLEAIARLEDSDQEPPCECQQTDVDLFDARGCELHDERSAWNVAHRAVTEVQRFETFSDMDECPF